jgi:hypothetical protein
VLSTMQYILRDITDFDFGVKDIPLLRKVIRWQLIASKTYEKGEYYIIFTL